MNTKNILFLALITVNFNAFGMKKVGDLLFGSPHKTAEFTGGWTLAKTYESAHHITVAPIEFDITKKLFLTHSFNSANIMNKETKENYFTFKHPEGAEIWQASFFPTGDRIVTISDDELLRIFALNNKELIAQFFCHEGHYSPENIRSVGFDKNGSLLVRTFQGKAYVYANSDKSREKQYIQELLIKYFAAKKSRTYIGTPEHLVTTFADIFTLDPEQLQIVWNSMPADTQELLLQAIQSSSNRE